MIIPPKEFKFGAYGVLDLKDCKARKKLEKWCHDNKDWPIKEENKIKLVIEAEFDGSINADFDGIGQEFTIHVRKVHVVK